MLDQYEEFRKIQLECSNVFLIDENFCVGQSYQIINNNLISLSTRLASFSTSINYFNNLFTHFAQNSSKYEEMNKNLEDFTDKFNSIYTYTKNTSSEWTRPI
jgi:DNA helicase HerA-like ATPase